MSRRATSGSGKNIAPNRHTAASNESSPNGSASASHWRNLTFVSARRRASPLAAMTISATASVHVTDPDGPTASAIVSAGSPRPLAPSCTVCTSWTPASSISARRTCPNIARQLSIGLAPRLRVARVHEGELLAPRHPLLNLLRRDSGRFHDCYLPRRGRYLPERRLVPGTRPGTTPSSSVFVSALRGQPRLDPVRFAPAVVLDVLIPHRRQFTGGRFGGVSRGTRTIDDDLRAFVRQQPRSQLSHAVRRQIDRARQVLVLEGHLRQRLDERERLAPIHLLLQLFSRYGLYHYLPPPARTTASLM